MVDIATVAALLFVLARKTYLVAVRSGHVGVVCLDEYFGIHANFRHVYEIVGRDCGGTSWSTYFNEWVGTF